MRSCSEPSQGVQAGFEPGRIAVTQRVISCYCASARCGRLWRFRKKSGISQTKDAERRTKGARATGRPRRLGKPREKLPSAGDVKNDTDRKSTRLNSSHLVISYAVFCLKKKN